MADQPRDQHPPMASAGIAATDGSPIFQCSICLDDVDIHDKAGTVACQHSFCNSCIKRWALRSRKCPLCRHPMFAIVVNKTIISLPPLIIVFQVRNLTGWGQHVRFKFRGYFKRIIKWYMRTCTPNLLSSSIPQCNIALFYNGSPVSASDSPRICGMADGDVITIKHKMKLSMERLLPLGNQRDQGYVRRSSRAVIVVWDHLTLDNVLRRFCSQRDIDITNYVFGCREKFISGLGDFTLHDLEFKHGETIYYYAKEDGGDVGAVQTADIHETSSGSKDGDVNAIDRDDVGPFEEVPNWLGLDELMLCVQY